MGFSGGDNIKAEIVIPTWNSMPELADTIKCLPDAFKGYSIDVYIVDKSSSDGSKEFAEEHDCHVIIDNCSLGSARLTGARNTSNKFIYFVDSDITLEKNWANRIGKYTSLLKDNLGMVFGNAIDKEKKLHKMQIDRVETSVRCLKKGERAWTNNTFVRRDLVLSSDIKTINAWEDWVIAQNIMKNGFRIYQVPVTCVHNHKSKSKWGFNRAGWNAKGMIDVVGLNFYSFKYINYYIMQGLLATLKYKDLFYMKWGVTTWMEVWNGVLNLKSFSRKQ